MDFEIRKDRNRQGRKPLTRERAAYFQLTEQGYSAREAARTVGIDRRTGKKWRNGHKRGRKAVPPIYQDLGHASGAAEDLEAPSCGPSRFLQERDRTHIADRLREKACSYCNLRNHATRVSREAVLNRGPVGVLGPLSVRPGDLVGRLAVSTTVYVHLMTQMNLPAFEREWTRFESWLHANSPADHAMLRRPADPERLIELESRLGFELHPELRALLLQHDGAAEPVVAPGTRRGRPAGAFLPLGHRLSGVDDIIVMYDVLVDVGDDNIDADLWEGDALAVNLHRCVPFALPNDGGVTFVDHRPGPSYGHVYEMGIGSGDLDGSLWATSLTQLFRNLANSLESDGPFLYYWPTPFEEASGHRFLEWHIRT